MEPKDKAADNMDSVQFGELIAQSKSNQTQITELRTEVRSLTAEIRNVVDALNSKITNATTPNYNAIWAGTGVLVAVVIALCGSLFYYFNVRFTLQDASTRETYHQLNTRIELTENERSRKAERYDDLADALLKRQLESKE